MNKIRKVDPVYLVYPVYRKRRLCPTCFIIILTFFVNFATILLTGSL